MKRLFIITAMVLGTVAFGGCAKDDLSGPDVLQDGRRKISLQFTEAEEVETYSTASTNERTISDVFVVVFDGASGKYKDMEKIYDEYIFGNGTQTPTINTIADIAENDNIVVLINTNAPRNPRFTKNHTVDDINTVVPSTQWKFGQSGDNSGKGMPMSGEVVWSNATPPVCRMYRSVAKIQVALAADLASKDATGKFTAATDAVQWAICNAPKKGDIYSLNGAMSVPEVTDADFVNENAAGEYPHRVTAMIGVIASQSNGYLPEYNSSVKAKTATVGDSEFAADRTCVLLKVAGAGVSGGAGYYRLDLVEGNKAGETKKYLDIRRNYHYTIHVTRVSSKGYDTPEEALAAPSSNVEYEITDNASNIIGNGQYAVVVDKNPIEVFPNMTTAQNLMMVGLRGEFPAGALCKVSLVHGKTSTAVATSEIQLLDTDGTAVTGNRFEQSIMGDYQFKYTSRTLSSTDLYARISYGNIVHYTPVNPSQAVFNVSGSISIPYSGGQGTYTVLSYRLSGDGSKILCPWTTEFSEDGGNTWSDTVPAWLTKFTPTAGGSILLETSYDAVVAAQNGTDPSNATLKNAAPKTDYNLSNSTGAAAVENTANCYLVNAPGTYKLPLVYGNAIKNGATNNRAYSTEVSGTHVLSNFVNHLDAAITDPYIYNNVGCTPSLENGATLVWTDETNLVTNVRTDGKFLYFEVPQESILEGNAIVAVLDTEGRIMWSWHIWVTDYVLGTDLKEVVNFQGNTYTMTPVNIGWCDPHTVSYAARALKVKFTQMGTGISKILDIVQSGKSIAQVGNSPYYIFGRKDPILAAIATNVSKSSYGPYLFDDRGVAPISIGTSIQTPHILYKPVDTNYSWTITPCYNTWDMSQTGYVTGYTKFTITKKTIYDPSPVGYVTPPDGLFTGFTLDGKNTAVSVGEPNVNGVFNRGWNIYCKPNKTGDTSFWPAMGNRVGNSPYPGIVGIQGAYWSSTSQIIIYPQQPGKIGGEGRSFVFRSSYVYPLTSTSHWAGYSIRPIREQ